MHHRISFGHSVQPRVAATVALASAVLVVWTAGEARAIGSFVETFDAGASGWVDGEFGVLTHHDTGGVEDSGYVSFTAPAFNAGTGGFGDPLKLMFRGNRSNAASGGAFAGDWLAGGAKRLRLSVRHDHANPLRLFVRIAGRFGAGASLANDARYVIPPDVWTEITIEVEDRDPPFVSYGTSTFKSVFSKISKLQIGFYLPARVDFERLRMDLDQVSLETTEPQSGSLSTP